MVAKQRRSSQKPLAGTLGSIADVGGGGEAKKHVKQDQIFEKYKNQVEVDIKKIKK